MHRYNQINLDDNEYFQDRKTYLKNKIYDINNYKNIKNTHSLGLKLYEKGYSAVDVIQIIETMDIDVEIKNNLLIYFDKIRKEFRNEKLLMLLIFYKFFMRKDIDLENIDEM